MQISSNLPQKKCHNFFFYVIADILTEQRPSHTVGPWYVMQVTASSNSQELLGKQGRLNCDTKISKIISTSWLLKLSCMADLLVLK